MRPCACGREIEMSFDRFALGFLPFLMVLFCFRNFEIAGFD